MSDTFDIIRKENRLAYEFICGSHLYGLNTKDSDLDTKGVFFCQPTSLLGLPSSYLSQVSDERNDTNWYEFGKFMEMLLTSNPTVLESLFVPKDKVIGEIHPIINNIMSYKNEFITKQCFNPFIRYALDQIHKARGLNKKITKPVYNRLQPLDFAYTFYIQGSTKISNWLEYRGLKQKYCGLVSIPNMHEVYGLYYDFGAHIIGEEITKEQLHKELVSSNINDFINMRFVRFYSEYIGCESLFQTIDALIDLEPIGYRGIVNDDGKSNTVRLSSVSKGEKPICHMSYNASGYEKHCIDYKNYKDWEAKRNPVRYESNLNKNYDSKNMSHTFRLINMGCEIANGDGIILDRREAGDAEFLLNIRNHVYEYDDLIVQCQEKEKELKIAIEHSTIKEMVDVDLVESLLIDSRKKYYDGKL